MENEKIQVEYRSNMSSTLKQHKQDMDNNSFEKNALREHHFHVLQREYSKLEEAQADISKLEAQAVAMSTALYIACIVCFVFVGLCCYLYTKCQPAPEAARPEYSVDQAYVRQLEKRLAVLQPQLRASTSSLASGRTDATLSFEYSTEDDSAASVIEI